MVTMASNTEYKSWLSSEDDTIVSLEKAQSGRTTLEDIADGLDEYKRLHIAGLASPAELVTLHRAFPDNVEYEEACEALKNDEGEFSFMVVGGPASVEVVDREGHLITTDALKKAFKKYMKNFRGRNVMVMHSDVQVGHALPVYISKAGNVFKSGVDDKGLFFIAEMRDDTKISNRVRDQIEKGGMKSYSIAGSATKSKDIKKSDGSSILQVDDMELAEVTICEKGVNQNAHFELLKGDKAEGSCVDGSCLTKSHDPAPEPEIIAISKSEMPSFKNLFMSWIAKEEKDSDKSTAMAIATAQAKKEGYKKFTDGSPGDNRRDKLAKEIKRSLKKAFLRKDLTDRERKSIEMIERQIRSMREQYPNQEGLYYPEGSFERVGLPYDYTNERFVMTPEERDRLVDAQQIGNFKGGVFRDKSKSGFDPYGYKVSSIPMIVDEQYGTKTYPSTSLSEPESESRVPFPDTYTMTVEDPDTGIQRQTMQRLTENITDEAGNPYTGPYYRVPRRPQQETDNQSGTKVQTLTKQLFLDKLKEIV
jgi:HK97 family phage prohead protease